MNGEKLRRLIKLVKSWHVYTRWLLAGIGALATLLYLNTLGNGFVFHDWPQIVNNAFLRRADALAKTFATEVWQFLGPVGVSNFYRPLMHAQFYLCFHIFGLNPAGCRGCGSLVLALLAAHSARTAIRNADWHDELTFYREAIADFAGFPQAHLNLGEAPQRCERLPEALEARQAVARLDPSMAGAIAIRLKDSVSESQSENKLGHTEMLRELVARVCVVEVRRRDAQPLVLVAVDDLHIKFSSA